MREWFDDEMNAQWDRESADHETRRTTVEIDGKTYLVKRETVIQVFADGSRKATVTTVTEVYDNYGIVIMVGDPMFHAASVASANILYGKEA